MTNTISNTEVNFDSPLQQLVLQQLAAIVNGEKRLKEQYAQLSAAPNSPETMEIFASRLADLNRRADRLHRMMDAMDGDFCFSGIQTSMEPAAA